jgi:hypothetical protein
VSTSVAKLSEVLSNKVSVIIRRYIDRKRFAAIMYVSFIIFFRILLVLFCNIVHMVVHFVCFCLILHKYVVCIFTVMHVPFWVFCFIALFLLLFVCKCVLYYCHRVATQFQFTNVSYPIISNGLRYTVSLLSTQNCNSTIYHFGMSIICIASNTNRNELCAISSYRASVLDTAQELRS